MRNLWIAIAGAAGAVSRYQVEGTVSRLTRGAFPWGTLVVNLSGCFLLGLVFTLLTERFLPQPDVRIAVTVGFLGAYTTMSTFAFESLRLGQDGAIGRATVNVVLSVGGGIFTAWLGTVVARAF